MNVDFFFFLNIADRTSVDYMHKFVRNFLTAHLPTRDSKDVQGLPDCFVLRWFNSFHLNLTDWRSNVGFLTWSINRDL